MDLASTPRSMCIIVQLAAMAISLISLRKTPAAVQASPRRSFRDETMVSCSCLIPASPFSYS